jgi:hypothetical protein
MSIRILLLLTIIGIILVTLGLLGLYVDVTLRLKRINNSIREQKRELGRTKDRVKVIEDRDRDSSNHVYFATDNEIEEERPDYSDIKYGGEGI